MAQQQRERPLLRRRAKQHRHAPAEGGGTYRQSITPARGEILEFAAKSATGGVASVTHRGDDEAGDDQSFDVAAGKGRQQEFVIAGYAIGGVEFTEAPDE